ncbi:DUF4222 domain-containing protein [Salmonella enterica]|uniref:DUF4222 domain-containing protein n=1 Tax=Salmonella newport TaxID=108619 RepID=A0A5Y0RN80_SALNE|nr:DUF4222 domain-containing protein [Salmonella enterica]EBS4085681.1 DUF4222 domain-containing protein [Salmonella enterica subsp. enterica serovar Newport]ECI2368006.1 DUF4222 domain-containing protein [Salmonella enterica subsp. enterica serovar Muenchen]ATI86716.1 hypothetical protein CGA24_18085 [Salmonella enterica subsp. enterica]EAQ7976016.1 DUF4222 domain-containing protein [Salmonella enterica]EBS4404906.1 DUF4222 domain-containing protein [Salmonella enterica subsp. enterica serova
MTIKNPGLTAGGRAHPEIRPGDKWKDKRGCLVTVESYRFNRVTFYRDGYASPCVQSDLRFLREFKPVEESQ